MTARAGDGAAPDAMASALAALGLTRGEPVRFRRADRVRWQAGSVHCIERDGTLRITDAEGSARTVALAFVQVQVRGTGRVGIRWEPAADRAGRAVQLTLGW